MTFTTPESSRIFIWLFNALQSLCIIFKKRQSVSNNVKAFHFLLSVLLTHSRAIYVTSFVIKYCCYYTLKSSNYYLKKFQAVYNICQNFWRHWWNAVLYCGQFRQQGSDFSLFHIYQETHNGSKLRERVTFLTRDTTGYLRGVSRLYLNDGYVDQILCTD